MFKILLSSSQPGCDAVSDISKLFALICFSDDGCCPFVFKMFLIKAKKGEGGKVKEMALFARTRAVYYLDKMLLFAKNYSVFSTLSKAPNVFLILFCTHYHPNVFFVLLCLCHFELVSLPWNWDSPLNFLVSFRVL
jgi:hypothetical protein